MGGSSRSCALSGLEIPQGDEAVLLSVFPQPFDRIGYSIMETPLRGAYSGYGTLDTESEDEITPEDTDKRQPVWVLASVLDGLQNIPDDYFGISLGEAYQDHERRIRAALSVPQEGGPEDMSFLVDAPCMITASDFRKSVRLGRFLHEGVSYITGHELFHAARNDPDGLETILSQYRVGWMIKTAEVTLRKRIVPGIIGAQHGGHQATIAFARLTIAIAEERLEDRPSPENG